MKLRNSIFITMIAIIAGIILIFGVFSVRSYERSLTGQVVNDYQESVGIMGNGARTLITYMEDFAKSVALDDFVVESIRQYQNAGGQMSVHKMTDLRSRWDGFSSVLFYSTTMIYNVDLYSNTDLIYSYHDLKLDASNSVIPQDIIARAFSQAPPVWTDLIRLRQQRKYNKNDEYGFAVVKSVRDSRARTIGCIALYVKESSFASLMNEMNHDDQRCFLINKNAQIVSSADKSALSMDIADVLGLDEDELSECFDKGSLLKRERGRPPKLYIMRGVSDADLGLICEIRLSDLVDQTRKMRALLWAIGIFAAGLALIGAGIASRRITLPLEKLMRVMEQIKTDNGKSDIRFREKNAGEIGVLAAQFNELMDQLDEYQARIMQEQERIWHDEVRLLQAQIVPHFLYNTLGVISSMVKLKMTDEAEAALQQLAAFYRLSLSNGKEIITIREEAELTQSYLALQQLRYIEYMEYSIEYDETIGDLPVPKLTIQPLVENVIHHGLRSDGRKCSILVSIKADEEGGALIRVWDDGTGIPAGRLKQLKEELDEAPKNSGSFGIININQRLKFFYGEKYRMEISSEEECFTEFLLYLPCADEKGMEHV